jgi:hypothetical protein
MRLAMGFMGLVMALLMGMSLRAMAQEPPRCAPYRMDWNNGLNQSLDQAALRGLRLRITSRGLSEVCAALLAEIDRQLERAEAAARAAPAPAPPRSPPPTLAVDEVAWGSAQRANTCDAYRSFLTLFPNSSFATQAQRERDRLCAPPPQPVAPAPVPPPPPAPAADEVAWANAQRAGSCEAFQGFLSLFPASSFSGPARVERDRLCPPPDTASMTQSNSPPAPQTVPPPVAVVASGLPNCPECPEMVPIPGQLFAAGRFEVTFAEWDACVAAGGCNGYQPYDQGWGRGRRPVINVSWNDAQAYVQWLSDRTGRRYRLLTSAEWEIAARAGTRTDYFWGDDPPVCDQNARNAANFLDCTNDRTRRVGSFRPNGFGLYDVHGNVWEWTNNSDGDYRVLRGGSWDSLAQSLRSAARVWDAPNGRDSTYGFRLARDLEG